MFRLSNYNVFHHLLQIRCSLKIKCSSLMSHELIYLQIRYCAVGQFPNSVWRCKRSIFHCPCPVLLRVVVSVCAWGCDVSGFLWALFFTTHFVFCALFRQLSVEQTCLVSCVRFRSTVVISATCSDSNSTLQIQFPVKLLLWFGLQVVVDGISLCFWLVQWKSDNNLSFKLQCFPFCVLLVFRNIRLNSSQIFTRV